MTAAAAGDRGPRRLVVLRHGETEHNAAGIWQGQLDSALSERGHVQARAAAAELRSLGPTRVLASDLSRAAVTGEEVARECEVPFALDPRLREIHVGAWSGRHGADVRAEYPEDMDRLLRGEDFPRGGDGETVAEVATRVGAATTDLLAELRGGECAVVATHGVAGRVLVAELTGLPQQQAWLVLAGLGNCHWAELVEGRGGWRIQTWNASA